MSSPWVRKVARGTVASTASACFTRCILCGNRVRRGALAAAPRESANSSVNPLLLSLWKRTKVGQPCWVSRNQKLPIGASFFQQLPSSSFAPAYLVDILTKLRYRYVYEMRLTPAKNVSIVCHEICSNAASSVRMCILQLILLPCHSLPEMFNDSPRNGTLPLDGAKGIGLLLP